VFVLWEEYRNEAALDFHKATEHYNRLVLNGVRPLAQERSGAMAVPI
jgi:quinol monooxygenase YgiN